MVAKQRLIVHRYPHGMYFGSGHPAGARRSDLIPALFEKLQIDALKCPFGLKFTIFLPWLRTNVTNHFVKILVIAKNDSVLVFKTTFEFSGDFS